MLAAIGLSLFVIGWFMIYLYQYNFWKTWAQNVGAIGVYMRIAGGALLLIAAIIWLIHHAA